MNRLTQAVSYGSKELTFADLSDVEVEPADGDVDVLDLLRHCCCSLLLLLEAGRPAREDVSAYNTGTLGEECRWAVKWTPTNVRSPTCLLSLDLSFLALPGVLCSSQDRDKNCTS